MTRAFFIQLKRELGAIFNSPMAYVIFFFFTLFTGIIFYQYIDVLEQGSRYSIIQLFLLNPWIWFPLPIVVALITMGTYSEEYKTGTIELLMTAPVGDWDVVLAKFFGGLIFYLGLWAPALLYLLVFQWVTDSQVPIQWASLGLCCLMFLLIGSFYISIGLFFSSLTRNQMLAGFMCFVCLLLFFFFGILTFFTPQSSFTHILEYIASYRHMQGFLDGVFDSRPVVLYLTSTLLFLALTQRVMAVKKLKS